MREVILRLRQRCLSLPHSLLGRSRGGLRILQTELGLIEQLLRLHALGAEAHRAFVCGLGGEKGGPGTLDLDSLRRHQRRGAVARRGVRGALHLHQPLPAMDRVPFVKIELFDLGDDVRRDIDLDLRIDFAGRADDRLDLPLAGLLGVDLLPLRAPTLHAGDDDDGDQDDRAADDQGSLHLRDPNIAPMAAGISFRPVQISHTVPRTVADFAFVKRETCAKPMAIRINDQMVKTSNEERKVKRTRWSWTSTRKARLERTSVGSPSTLKGSDLVTRIPATIKPWMICGTQP